MARVADRRRMSKCSGELPLGTFLETNATVMLLIRVAALYPWVRAGLRCVHWRGSGKWSCVIHLVPSTFHLFSKSSIHCVQSPNAYKAYEEGAKVVRGLADGSVRDHLSLWFSCLLDALPDSP